MLMWARGGPEAASAFKARTEKDVPAWKARKGPLKKREGTQSFQGMKQVAPERVMKNVKSECIAHVRDACI